MRLGTGLEQNPNGITMTEAAFIANLSVEQYLGYDRVIIKFLSETSFRNAFSYTN